MVPRDSSNMNTATPFPWPELSPAENTRTTFRAIFEHAPIAVARCNPQGVIVEMNTAFARTLNRGVGSRRSLRLSELGSPQERDTTESLLRDLLASRRDSIGIDAGGAGAGPDQASAKWTAWRQPGCAGEPDHALLIAEQTSDAVPPREGLLQSQRWEAVGRLAVGVVNSDQTQVRQILLNLVLNARDALPQGGRITVETSNCRFQPVAGTIAPGAPPVFPCVLLAVGDNGHGMEAETRQHLFEPFFTTKNAGQGTRPGLTTLRTLWHNNSG